MTAAATVPRLGDELDELDDGPPTTVGPILAPDQVRELMDDAEKNSAPPMPAIPARPAKPMPPRPQSGLRRAVRPEDHAPKPAPRASAVEIDIEIDVASLEPAIEIEHLHEDTDHDE